MQLVKSNAATYSGIFQTCWELVHWKYVQQYLIMSVLPVGNNFIKEKK